MLTSPCDSALVWLRRDLRLADHAPLAAALRMARRVHVAFVFDTAILDALPRADRRVEFIHASLAELDARLRALGGGLIVCHGRAADEIPALAQRLGVDAVCAGRDYEPYASERDATVAQRLAAAGRRWVQIKDHVVFERDELLTGARRPYTVFTPYKRAWLARLDASAVAEHAVDPAPGQLVAPPAGTGLPPLDALGFAPAGLARLPLPAGEGGAQQLLADFLARIDDYRAARDYPAVRGVSYLSTHLRFGTVSIRALVRAASARPAGSEGAATWLAELVWRDFYQQILWHHPHVVERSFRPEYDRIAWEQGEPADERYAAWEAGRTGYPLVDAAMAQIAQTGYMHNRLRMVVASFLAKDLGVDWRRGEAYFARALNDFDLAANNGGWQWAASSGCDAQPWFRIFNPVTQSEKFDPEGKFIRRYLPQLARFEAKDIHAPWLASAERQRAAGCVIGTDYPAPIVDHATARAATLARYAVVKGRSD
ncbi:MAG TPA: deoxyribodipyrimidine photo-lyase [Burkholderiaceae bacterium]|nr:deoxyribodipyrimidine photo-lyase [Burkholderiaceae bacterium]HRZ01046.1 deoxyribodipyrimidine photo-lyase [Burkholderiaceae bacterium]